MRVTIGLTAEIYVSYSAVLTTDSCI